MGTKGKFILWTAVIALGTFYVVQKIDFLRQFAYGTSPSVTPPSNPK